MDQQEQREQFRDIVLTAMRAKSWSAAQLAREAGVTQAVTTRVKKAEPIQPGNARKIREALGIDALAEAQARNGYSQDVQLIRDAIGMWLRDTPEDKRAEKVARMLAAIANNGA